jgi:RNA recognition motif-containing protein
MMGSMPSDLKKKTLRVAAGQVWTDPTLADWPDDDYRVFVGNLGPEVTDSDLNRAFSKYKSLLRVRVIMESGPRGKSRGYGFLSFGDPHDFLAAMKEMNGPYLICLIHDIAVSD